MRSLLAYFSITYAVSWTLFAAAAWMTALAPTPASPAMASAVVLLGVIVPSFVALGLTARAEGHAGVATLLGRILHVPGQVRWYVFAIGFMAGVKLLAAAVHRVSVGAWPQFGDTPIVIMLAATLLSTPVQAGEEIGWRGYALPRLSQLLGLAPASLLLGVIWASWHLPLFFILTGDTLHQSFPLYLLQVTALSVAAAWLYWRTGQSLLVVMLMHAAVNNTKDIVPSAVRGATNPFALSTSLVAWLTVAILWLAAAYLLWQMRGAAIEPSPAAGEAAARALTGGPW